ncbi:hypothetical protein HXZ66_02340 [Bacillus sp. A116_S68]|nr:hypothetical protein HXZ66_02340 [Bacillus sp. A116_S68]
MNRTKKIFIITFIMILGVITSACNSGVNELIDYTNDELQTYNDMWKGIEADLVTISYFTGSDEELYEMYDKVIPELQKQLDFVESVSLDFDEAVELHTILISSVEKELIAYTKYQEALSYLLEGDEEEYNRLFDEATLSLEESYEEIDDYNNMLDDLGDKYNFEIIE